MGDEPELPPPYSPDWAEAGADTLLAAARKHLVEIACNEIAAGDVLLFRWRAAMPAKHCAVATSPDTMIHAHDGASVAEVAFHPWWRRHLAHAFRFPDRI
jgi:NlpC/P60 family putative phage cell wall peptidase